MIQFISDLYDRLEENLIQVQQNASSSLECQHRSVMLTEEAIKRMKEWLREHCFQTETEEVDFFRNRFPLFYSKLIYHLNVYRLELRHRGVGRKVYKRALRGELRTIDLFWEKQTEFCQYYHSGSDRMDKELFTRMRPVPPLLAVDCSWALDPEFCTTYAVVLSQMMAFEKLQEHLLSELELLNNKELPFGAIGIPPKKKWQLGPFALVELGYMLHLTGAVPGNLKDTMQFLENCFDTPLGNYSRTFQKMRIRKEERASYLTRGIDSIYKHMDDLDTGEY